jgi:hypothetical protein
MILDFSCKGSVFVRVFKERSRPIESTLGEKKRDRIKDSTQPLGGKEAKCYALLVEETAHNIFGSKKKKKGRINDLTQPFGRRENKPRSSYSSRRQRTGKPYKAVAEIVRREES